MNRTLIRMESKRSHIMQFSLGKVLSILSLAGAVSGQTPRTAADFYNRGLQRQEQGDLEGALGDYNQAITLSPRLATAYTIEPTSNLARVIWMDQRLHMRLGNGIKLR